MRKTKLQNILVLNEFIYIYEVALKLLSNLKSYYGSPSNTNTNTSSPEMESYTYRSHDIRSEERRVGKEEGEVERESWIEDNKVVMYEDCGHILCDLAST